MDYETFDIGNFEDKICTEILTCLKDRPMTVHELSKEIYDNEDDNFKLSPKLQKLKSIGMISNIKDSNNVCYWGVPKKYRNTINQ